MDCQRIFKLNIHYEMLLLEDQWTFLKELYHLLLFLLKA